MDRSTVIGGLAGVLSTTVIGPQIVDVLDWIVQLHWGIPIPTKPASAMSGLINVAVMLFATHYTKDKPVLVDGTTVDAKPRDVKLSEDERAKLRATLAETTTPKV